jgi:hypothetical protein
MKGPTKIEFLNKVPTTAAQVIMLDRELLNRAGCISIDNVAFVFTPEAANAAEPDGLQTVKCSIRETDAPPKGKKLLRHIDLFRLRKAAGASAAEWAEKLGVTSASVSSVERLQPIGERTLATLEKSLKAKLDIPLFLDPSSTPLSERRLLGKERDVFTRKMRGARVSASKRA